MTNLHMGVIKAPLCNSIPLLPPDLGNQRIASGNRYLAIYRFALNRFRGGGRSHAEAGTIRSC
jgi:hypothetical protein